jgi:hypothetical protein
LIATYCGNVPEATHGIFPNGEIANNKKNNIEDKIGKQQPVDARIPNERKVCKQVAIYFRDHSNLLCIKTAAG